MDDVVGFARRRVSMGRGRVGFGNQTNMSLLSSIRAMLHLQGLQGRGVYRMMSHFFIGQFWGHGPTPEIRGDV